MVAYGHQIVGKPANWFEHGRVADLDGVNLTSRRSRKVTYANKREKARLSGMDFTDATVEWADLEGIHLKGTNFNRAQLRLTNLRKASLRNAGLRDADLTGAELANTVVGTKWPSARLYRSAKADG